jgi:hypothetical protein
MKKNLHSLRKLFFAALLGLSAYTTKAQMSADLILNSFSCNYDGQTAILSNISYVMKNQGNLTTFGSVTNNLFIVDIGSSSWFIGDNVTDGLGIAAGATESLTIGDVDLDTLLTQTGTYYLKIVIDANDEESESNETNNLVTSSGSSGSFNFIALVGIKENKNASDLVFKVYPNPAKDLATLSFSTREGGDVKLEIFDITGKNILTIDKFGDHAGASSLHAKQIDVSDFENGIYFCKLTGKNSTVTEKLVIQK